MTEFKRNIHFHIVSNLDITGYYSTDLDKRVESITFYSLPSSTICYIELQNGLAVSNEVHNINHEAPDSYNYIISLEGALTKVEKLLGFRPTVNSEYNYDLSNFVARLVSLDEAQCDTDNMT